MADDGFILLYHALFARVPETMRIGLHNVTPDAFASQLGWLKETHDVIDLEAWLALDDRRGKVALTFDDGYGSALAEAVPVLEALGLTATFFLNGAMLEGGVFWRDRMRQLIHAGLASRFCDALPPETPGRQFLTPAQLFEASKSPQVIDSLKMSALIEAFLGREGVALDPSYCAAAAALPDHASVVYGSHGYHHAVLSSLSDEEARRDIRRNRQALEGLSLAKARATTVFAVPFGTPGTYTPATLRILAEEGHGRVVLTSGSDRGARRPGATPVQLASRLTAPPSLEGLQAGLGGRARGGAPGPAPPRGGPSFLAITLDGIADRRRFAERLVGALAGATTGTETLLLGIEPVAGTSPTPAWSEIGELEGVVRYARSVRYLVFTTITAVSAVVEDLEAICSGIDLHRPFFTFLVERDAPPLYSARADGLVLSFLCDAELFAGLLSSAGRQVADVTCFRIAAMILSLQVDLPQIFVRQFPALAPVIARAPPPGPISITLPHRGPPHYLATCLRSLVNQHAVDLAVDVVIDEPIGSAHRSIIEAFPQVTFYGLEPHGSGWAVARQFLIYRSANALIAHQDSDDLATSDRLALLHAELLARDAEIVGCHELRVDEVEKRVVAYRFPLDVRASLQRGPYHAQLSGSILARRRSITEIGGLSTAFRFSADTQFLYRAFFLGRRMVNIDEFLYVRRVWGGALTASPEVGWRTPERQRVEGAFRRGFQLVRQGMVPLKDSVLAVRSPSGYFDFTNLRTKERLRVRFPS